MGRLDPSVAIGHAPGTGPWPALEYIAMADPDRRRSGCRAHEDLEFTVREPGRVGIGRQRFIGDLGLWKGPTLVELADGIPHEVMEIPVVDRRSDGPAER